MQIDAANTNEDINNIVDEPKYLSLVNCSGWNPTKCINNNSKHEFLYLLIKEEVILKRITSMDALINGLERLGVVTLLRTHPQVFKELFTYNARPLTASGFVSLMTPCSLSDMPMDHIQAYKWFLEYLKARETCKLCMHIRYTCIDISRCL